MPPTVSVNLCCYNGERYLVEALESVCAQTYKDWELIIIDDGSTDSTAAIIERYIGAGWPIRYHWQENAGLGRARNKCLELSSGRYIAFIDQDDLWLPEKLAVQVSLFEGPVGLVYSNTLFFGTDQHRDTPFYSRRRPPPSGHIFRPLLRKYFLSLESVLIRRDILPMDPGEWFPAGFDMCEEADLFLRLAYGHPCAYAPQVLSKYRIHERQWSVVRSHLFIVEQERMMERLKERIPGLERDYGDELQSLRASISQSRGEEYLKGGRRWAALAAFADAFSKSLRPEHAAMALIATFADHAFYLRLRRLLGRS